MLKHEHLIVRAEIANVPRDYVLAETWLHSLISDLDMDIMAGPFGGYSEVIGSRGLTIGAVITTSHIVMHVFDEPSPAILQLDVYSCKKVDPTVVLEALEEFKPSNIEYMFLDRESSLVRMV